MLTAYLQRVQQLLFDVKQDVLNPAFLTGFINTARGQLAGEAECIRVSGTISTGVLQGAYSFATINTGTPATTGVQGVINVRQMSRGQNWMTPRPWDYFNYYYSNNAGIAAGPPTRWAQYGQGSAGTGTGSGQAGTFHINPLPDAVYVLYCDCICYPIALVNDSTAEAIPYLWTDAVPFFATYLAYLSVQQHDKAKGMFEIYTQFKDRARQSANPPVDRWMYQQSGISQGVDPNAQQGQR